MRPLALLVSTLAALAAVPAVGQQPLRIMPIGDSITEGRDGDFTYRFFLYHALRQTGHCIDLVGEHRGVLNGKPARPDFDQDHQAYWGMRTEQVLVRLPFPVLKHRPDVALIHLGTNDLIFQQSVTSTVRELETMIDVLRLGNPRVAVLVALIIPNRLVDVSVLNSGIARMAVRRYTAASPVVAVDAMRGFDHRRHTYDGIHPNALGEQLIAGHFVSAVLGLGRRCRAAYALQGTGCGAPNEPPPRLVLPAGQRPRIGVPFTVAVTGLPEDRGPIVGLLGFGELAGRGLPVGLGGLGMPGCALWAPPDLVVPLATASGFATWTLDVPADPWTAGLRFHQQVLIVSPSANAFGLALSGGGSGVVGAR